ncbi:MAG: MarR family transcriptional regulator [Planctomycetota bacterium]
MSSLREQIGKQQPFDDPHEEAYLNIIRTAAIFGGEFKRLFKRHGLGESGYNVLRMLRAAGDAGKTWTEICSELVVPAPDATRIVTRLETAGLATRSRSIDDRRVIRVFITPAGRSAVDELEAPIRRLHLAQLGHLSPADLERLSRALERARAPSEEGLRPE